MKQFQTVDNISINITKLDDGDDSVEQKYFENVWSTSSCQKLGKWPFVYPYSSSCKPYLKHHVIWHEKADARSHQALIDPSFWLTRLSISDFKCFCGITTSAAIWFPLSHFGMDFISSSLRLCKIRDDCGQAAIQLGLPYTETSLTVLTSSYLFVT